MKRSTKSCPGPEPLEGEVLPPKPKPATFEELEQFCAQYGVRVPRPRSYRSVKAAMAAIVARELRAASK
jgi:hypothetical protein